MVVFCLLAKFFRGDKIFSTRNLQDRTFDSAERIGPQPDFILNSAWGAFPYPRGQGTVPL